MATMSDIAERAGVSRATVSYVLSNREGVRVSDGTRHQVQETARQMGYHPNELARAVVTGKNRVLGFLVSMPEYETVARMLAGALEEADAHNYLIKVLRLPQNTVERRIIDRCVESRLAGVISLFLDEDNLAYLRDEMYRHEIPVAVLDVSFPQTWGTRIVSDDRQGMMSAVEHLLSLGHRRIALLSTPSPQSAQVIIREEGFVAAMKKAKRTVPQDYILRASAWSSEGVQAALQNLQQGSAALPTAICCMTDHAAMAAIRAARRSGLRVPEDISITGFADMEASKLVDPPLTTVAQPFREMGKLAVKRLLESIDGGAVVPNEEPREELLPTRLIVRESTKVLLEEEVVVA